MRKIVVPSLCLTFASGIVCFGCFRIIPPFFVITKRIAYLRKRKRVNKLCKTSVGHNFIGPLGVATNQLTTIF